MTMQKPMIYGTEVDCENIQIPKFHDTKMAKKFKNVGGQLRILIGHFQITSALVFSFDIPWPPMSLAFLPTCFTSVYPIDTLIPRYTCIFNLRNRHRRNHLHRHFH